MSDQEAVASLGKDINKADGTTSDETKVGIVSEKVPELELSMSDEDIVKLTDKWEKEWNDSDVKAEWEKQCKENLEYWEGKQFDTPKGDKTRPNVDNIIFESLETYLPSTTRRNPEPIVMLDAKEKGKDGTELPAHVAYVEKVKGRLIDLADKNVVRLKVKKAARHWAISLVGVAKVGWDLDMNMPIVRVIRPSKVIFDPNATVDEDGYSGRRIGEFRKLPASMIIDLVESVKKKPEPVEGVVPEESDEAKASSEGLNALKEKVKEDIATEVQFVEWWTPEYTCWKFGKHILLKKKNPHWNYDQTVTPDVNNIVDPNVSVDDYGNATAEESVIKGINHFETPQMPFVFLSVFNLGDRPMDKTSLISQNLANQDRINKRNKQIDKNADSMNGGMVVSLERSGLTRDQAKGVTEALKKGGTVLIPTGAPKDAVDRFQVSGLPADVYNDLVDTRTRVRDIFGTSGSTPAGLGDEKTVRGKIMNRGLDTDRIGGGVSEYLEQFADQIYNWFVQLLYVYDDGFQFVEGGVPPKIIVSVKEGSLLPKDSTSLANQAIELALANKLSLVDLFKALERPNPEELAANVWLEANAPQLLYANNPMVQQAIAMQQEAAQAEAEARQKEGEMKHGQEIEKKTLEGGMKMAGEEHRSMLAQVPQNAVE